MGKERQRLRTRSKIDDLPTELKEQVIAMVGDTKNTYTEISDFLKAKNYDISRSSVGRYAYTSRMTLQRLQKAQEEARLLVQTVKNNPNEDYTEAGVQILTSELTKRLAMAEEEFDTLPLDKAARVMVQLTKTQAYKDKLQREASDKLKQALEAFKVEVYKEIESVEPELYQKIIQVADRTYNKLRGDET